MYMPLLATESGVLKTLKPAGSILSAGDVIASLVLDDPSRVKMATIFDGGFPDFGPSQMLGDKAHQKYKQIKAQVDAILQGFSYQGQMSLLVRSLIELLRNPELAFLETLEVLSSLAGRIPAKLESDLIQILADHRGQSFPIKLLLEKIKAFSDTLTLDERNSLDASLLPVRNVLNEYAEGIKHTRSKS